MPVLAVRLRSNDNCYINSSKSFAVIYNCSLFNALATEGKKQLVKSEKPIEEDFYFHRNTCLPRLSISKKNFVHFKCFFFSCSHFCKKVFFSKRQEMRIKTSFKFIGLEKMSLGEIISQTFSISSNRFLIFLPDDIYFASSPAYHKKC